MNLPHIHTWHDPNATQPVPYVHQAPYMPACPCQHTPQGWQLPAHSPMAAPVPPARPGVKVTPAALGLATAGVLVLGAVLVSMLLAVAVTAVSLTLCALVLRSMLHRHQREQRR